MPENESDERAGPPDQSHSVGELNPADESKSMNVPDSPDGVHPDRAAWIASVLAEYEGPLMRYAARLTRDADRARDAVQETFLRVCREGPANLNGRLAPWLYAVCRSRVVDAKRKERRMQTLEAEQAATLMTADAGPVAAALDGEGTSSVLAALSRLSANQQEVIRLRFQSGLSYKEIASVTRLSVSNVGFLIHTAVKRIREMLDNPAQGRRDSGT